MKQYARYKSSGIEWIGEIPDHWEVRKLKYVGQVQLSGVDKKNEPEEIKVLLCNYIDVYKNEFIDDSLSFMEASATKNEIERFALNRGDVLITKDSETPDDIANPAFVRVEKVEIICGYHLAHIRTNRDIMIGEFLFRLFQSPDFNAKFTVNAHGITRYGLSIDDIKSTKVLLPTVNEQTGISNYLDRKTAQIDELIAKKQKLSDLLNEEKTAIINQAVTKGLNPTAPMKHSGIPWLGEMPANWEVKKLKYLAWAINEKTEYDIEFKISLENIESKTGRLISLENENNFQGELRKFQKGDVLFNKLRPYLAKAYLADKNGGCLGELLIFRSKGELIPTFLFYRVLSYDFIKIVDSSTYGSKMPRASWDDFISQLLIPYPQNDEQTAIANYLDRKTDQMDDVISKTHHEIELLREYRTALISEAVTGKIDVRI